MKQELLQANLAEIFNIVLFHEVRSAGLTSLFDEGRGGSLTVEFVDWENIKVKVEIGGIVDIMELDIVNDIIKFNDYNAWKVGIKEDDNDFKTIKEILILIQNDITTLLKK